MPYYGDRLRDSDLNSRATDAEYRAAHNLWWSSWKQVPAASLPDDDVVLARLADLNRDVRRWKKLRDVALRGFVKCSDGRLYHKVLGPIAIEMWRVRLSQSARARKRWQDRQGDAGAYAAGDAAARSGHLPGIPPAYATADAAAYPAGDAAGDARIGKERKGEENPSPLTPPPKHGDRPFVLPDFIDPEVWAGFERHRREGVKVPLTDLARRLTVEKLAEYRAAGDDPNAVLKQSIEFGYRGVFPLKGLQPVKNPNRQESLEDRNRAVVERWKPPEEAKSR